MSTIMDETGRQLARRIRLEREARNWSLAELAERAGVAKATISKIERGEVSGHVQSEPVGGHTAGHTDPDRGDLRRRA